MKKCYNCEIELNTLPKENRTKEHIPAKSLFSGFPEEYKAQRLTVPACRKCNAAYSKIDDDLRDLIGFTNDNDESYIQLTKNAVKRVLSNKKNRDKRLSFSNSEAFIEFDQNLLESLHIKNFKGVFQKTFGVPISRNFSFVVFSDGDDYKKFQLGKDFYSELIRLGNWKFSGHPDVFTYKLAYFDIEKKALNDLEIISSNPKYILCALKYVNSLTAVVFAENKL